jgi:hypothetical protein
LSESVEKLEVARAITGSTHLLTRSKPIVFIEGEPDKGHTASDERLIRLILPQVEHWALVPVHGKSQVISSVRNMRGAELRLPGLPVFGLVDGDQSTVPGEDTVLPWPVAMIENLLLDAEIIAKVLEPYTGVQNRTRSAIERQLRAIVDGRKDDEVRLRVKDALPTATIRPEGLTSSDIGRIVDDTVNEYKAKLARNDVEDVVRKATDDVEQIKASHAEVDRFHGKKILRSLYDNLRVSSAGLSWNAFLTELARNSTDTDRVNRLTRPAIERIKLYFRSILSVVWKALQHRIKD